MLHSTQPHQVRTPTTVQAFGQTWSFTRDVRSALALYGFQTQKSLKALVVELATAKGLEEGRHEAEIFGIDLIITVRGDRIVVDDKYSVGGYE